jgi:hypothetical protein
MIPKIIRETEPRIKQRYHFAASAFVRMWGHSSLNDHRIIDFCVEWAHKTENAPLDSSVLDQYFYFEFKTWRGY